MVDEVLEFLSPRRGDKVLDATIGCGGHAESILQRIQPSGILVGIDRDQSSLKIAKERLKDFDKLCRFAHANFSGLDAVLSDLGMDAIDAALFDLGISSFQLDDPLRGFSFEKDGVLDMRMDPSESTRASDLVNRLSRDELAGIIRDFGEERYAGRIAAAIVERRKKEPIKTTVDLAGIVKRAVGRKYAGQRLHPATRTFQGIRIALNRELENIETAMDKITGFLGAGGRLCVISFHSLEDRIIKNKFREFEKMGLGNIMTKKPVRPADNETETNPRSRSAKLRAFTVLGRQG
ncbi:MAG: 16S rRNA (cytosine(1402)-N(4))-methyltransferase RsmH [Candidatus Omnitrophica bacterium]|nr:16S rRNA (cytosine(1402)-N(4))-methyltransferase RsmH [Candidatus Omnitrophota bacterium]